VFLGAVKTVGEIDDNLLQPAELCHAPTSGVAARRGRPAASGRRALARGAV